MKHHTYQTLYQAHLGNVNEKNLLEARAQETDPFYHNLIDLILEKKEIKVDWPINLFTDTFRSGSPRERLDETVFAFILRIVAINKEERYLRAFQKPESFDAVMAWEAILRRIILCTFALLYHVRWTPESIFTLLEPTVMELLSGGHVFALRNLMTSLGISLARETPYQAELHFEKLNFLHVGQYSSFYWRYLHWMAEAYHMRTKADMAFYKRQWLELLNESLYRTLRCGICMYHFRTMLNELKPQLIDPKTNFPKLWFDIHNRVHAQRREQYTFLKEPDYSESEYEADRDFMLQALVP